MSEEGSARHDRESRKFAAPPFGGAFAEPWSARKLLGLLAVFGPAAIVASVSIGAGETIVVVRAGAWARYRLLRSNIHGSLIRIRLPMLAGAVASALVLFAYAGISGWGLAGKLFGIG